MLAGREPDQHFHLGHLFVLEAFRAPLILHERANHGRAEVVGEDGEVNRMKLGPIVFGNPAQMARLNGIVWPAIAALAAEERAAAKAQGAAVVVILWVNKERMPASKA